LQPLLKLYIMKITHMLSLGKSYAFTLCIFLFSSFIFGQTIVQYSFNNNLNHDATPVPPTGTSLVFKGSNHAVKTPQYDNNRLVSTAINDYLELTINTTGLTGMTLSFDASFSGIGWGTWTVLTSNGNASGNNWNNYVEIGDITFGLFFGYSGNITIPIPAASENKTNVKFRIRSNFLSLGQTLRIDNLKIFKPTANITVSTDSNVLIPHNSTASLPYNTDFGEAIVVESSKLSPYFRIRNINGTGTLNITGISTTGINASDFTIENISTYTVNPSSSITSNAYAQFRVRFRPTGDGLRKATVNIYSNGNQSPYSFEVVGQGASCSLFTTPYVINTFNPDIIEPTLPSNITSSNIITGTAEQNNIVRIYPNGNISMGPDNSSWYVRNSTREFEFGGIDGIDVSAQKDVSVVFNIGAYSTNNSSEVGPNNGSYILLKMEHNGEYKDEVKLNGSQNTSGYSYQIANSTSNTTSFTKTYNGDLSEITNRNEGLIFITKYRYNTIRVNIPASKIAQDPTLKFKLEIKSSHNARIWIVDNVRIEVSNSVFTEFNNGTWSQGTPTSTKKAVIRNGAVTVPPQGYEMCECEVMQNGSLTVPQNTVLKVKGKVINHNPSGDNFIVAHNGNLIQIEPDAVNVGNISVFRTSAEMVKNDATFWSSPVTGQNLRNFSPNTNLKRFYIYNKLTSPGVTSDYKALLDADSSYPMVNPIPTSWYEEGELLNSHFNPNTYTFKKGWGYSIRVPNSWSSTIPDEYNGKFVGVPNNGDVEVPVYGNYTLIGNPYPSDISTHMFLQENPNVNSVHFWTHRYPVGHLYYDYGYMHATQFGTSGIPEPNGTETQIGFIGSIKVGQGFVVQNTEVVDPQQEWVVRFNNYMRMSLGGNFNRNSEFTEPETHKFWLGLYDQEGLKIAQILLGYMEGATDNFDYQIDGKRMGSVPFYSLLDEGKMVIQARALPFQQEDVILLGFVAPKTGTFKISIDDFTGMFLDGQEIFLKDKEQGLVHNLTESDYDFEANQGTFNHRFEIIFKKKPSFVKSVTTANKMESNNIEINKINHHIEINSSIDKITSIQVYNISGRLLMEENDINKLNYSIQTTGFEPSIIIVRGFTETGETFNQKFIIN
jgi:hypothetical protein